MALWVQEEGEGKTVIFLHGMFGDGGNLQRLTKALRERFHCVYLDLRNHGRSDHYEQISFELMAQDIAGLPVFQSSREVFLVGHSLGGKVAMFLAGLYPEKIKGFIAIDIAPVQYEPWHTAIFTGLNAVSFDKSMSRGRAEQVLSKYVTDAGIRGFLLKSLRRDPEGGVYRWRFNLPVLEACYPLLTEAINSRYNGPALFIRGEKSGYIDSSGETVINAAYPLAKIETVSSAGHWPHIEQPDVVLDLIRHFLERN